MDELQFKFKMQFVWRQSMTSMYNNAQACHAVVINICNRMIHPKAVLNVLGSVTYRSDIELHAVYF